MEARLPNLLVIGSMKCGTSSLHDYLNLHPDIFMSEPKEIHYYADADFLSKSKDWYLSHFKTDKKVVGTTPQSYTKCHNKFYLNIPERIHKDSPDIKMIYIMRDPIERYRSHILESYHCDPQEDIAYSKESGNYLKTGLYYMQLTEYLKYFELKQIHLMCIEDLKDDSLGEMNKIFDFLGLEAMQEEVAFDFVSNDASTKTIPTIIRDHLLYRIGSKIAPAMTEGIASKMAEIYFKVQIKKPILTDSELSELKEIYAKDVEKLRELSGLRFEKWSV